ncbi:hypothetical protein K461DRAFT_281140 [Myriangium duriaei CBS 260.36]|uniref:Grh/CP2 DB domain-containing protein n=1 Tax=Myriangium duriaei CBS 260.36 TaxID=1168546 RepID=A0A9P4IY79_9PEZI|nr:hypothetical protein K461DRAFT_281140 [Myriangium duriaei CBS 260.36]
MFRNRKNSQKPPDGFYQDFKASFPKLRQESTSAPSGQASLSEAIDDSALDLHTFHDRPDAHHEPGKDGEPTPRGNVDAWGFGSGLTPSLLDPNSSSFNSFANQMPGYYTPTPGGNSTLFHSHHAGDLHTPGFQYGLGTPLSMPTSEATMHAGQTLAVPGFAPQQQMSHSLPSQHQFQGMDPYQLHQQPFNTHSFSNPPPSFHHMDSHSSGSPSMGDVQMNMGMDQSPELMFHPDSFRQNASPVKFPHPLTEKFRYHVTLNAPTAMVKHEDEIPITYLNKGQIYTLNVVDTAPQHSQVGQLKYRTFVRVSFEDPDQRKKPSACWQLWKEGRGSNEAHHRGGKLQAVEFVDPAQTSGSGNDPRRAKMEIEQASFDGFCVTWTPSSMSGQIDCPIPVRFNFLSTDFSHSKGVKGIPVRLTAKTELYLDSMSPNTNAAPAHEICYCKVKLFRDHGAERKLSNDVAHVKKSIEKVNQQIAQMEAGMRDLGKRKRSSAGQESQRPGKIPKHRRTWSMSSANSPGKSSAEDELHMKLTILQEMFSSTRPSSILFLRGTSEDDADLQPVRLTGEPATLTKTETNDSGTWDRQSTQSSTMVSPTPSNVSISSNSRHDSGLQPSRSATRVDSLEWKPQKTQQLQQITSAPQQHQQQQTQMGNVDNRNANPQHLASPPDQPSRVQTSSPTSGTLSGWIESLGVDPSYRPPPERAIKPVACFHLQPRIAGIKSDNDYYRTIYLMQRTLRDFVTAICLKINLEPNKVLRTTRINGQGLQMLFDDTDIVEMREGQDMVAEFSPVDESSGFGQQWNSGIADIQVDGDLSSVQESPSSGYELKLYF